MRRPDLFVMFGLDGEPRGWERPGAMIRRGRIHWYVRAEEEHYRKSIGWSAKTAMKGRQPTDKPVALTVRAFLPIPNSWSKKKKDEARNGLVLPTSKPDWDNLGKVVADALKGIVWNDDAAVCDGQVIKRYADQPKLVVEVWEMVL